MRFKMPKFTRLLGEDNQLTIEHILHFMVECKEIVSNKFLEMKYFPLFLTFIAFSWYKDFE